MRGIKNDHPVALDVHRAPKLNGINHPKAPLDINNTTIRSIVLPLYASLPTRTTTDRKHSNNNDSECDDSPREKELVWYSLNELLLL